MVHKSRFIHMYLTKTFKLQISIHVIELCNITKRTLSVPILLLLADRICVK
jgi:hypothetical protein